MFHHVARDLFPEFLHKLRPFRSWADETHIPFQHIEKLRKLVYAGLSHKSSDSCHPWVIFYGPALLLLPLRLHFHGTELVHLKRTVMKADSLLLENQRSR